MASKHLLFFSAYFFPFLSRGIKISIYRARANFKAELTGDDVSRIERGLLVSTTFALPLLVLCEGARAGWGGRLGLELRPYSLALTPTTYSHATFRRTDRALPCVNTPGRSFAHAPAALAGPMRTLGHLKDESAWSRESMEQTFLEHAIGMALGWSWHPYFKVEQLPNKERCGARLVVASLLYGGTAAK